MFLVVKLLSLVVRNERFMIHLVTLNPALDFFFKVKKPLKGKIGHVQDARMEAGGKALNIARFLKKWGIPHVTWLGTGGGDHPTQRLYRILLEQEGLSARFLSSQSPVRSNMVIENDRESSKYNHSGYPVKGKILEPLSKAVRTGDFLVLTGSLPQGLNPSFYAKTISAFKKRGVQVLLDTSGKALEQTLKSNPWFLKVNLFEMSDALGLKILDLKEVPGMVKHLFLPRGLNFGAITHGAHGAVVWKDREIFWVKPVSGIKSRLVVGAGDAFLAGFIKGLKEKKSLEDCARLACAAGSVVAMKGIQGFQPGLVSKQMKNIRVFPI